MPYVEINAATIPECVRAALASCGKQGGNVEIIPAVKVHLGGSAFTGNRPVAVAVHLDTGERSPVRYGSWGGANPFSAPALDAQREYAIPPRTVVIEGETGGRGTFVRVYVHPDSIAPLLPAGNGAHDLSEREKRVLCAHTFLNSRGRKEFFERRGWNVEADKARLAALGLLKVSRNGAAKVTAAGRNAAEPLRYEVGSLY